MAIDLAIDTDAILDAPTSPAREAVDEVEVGIDKDEDEDEVDRDEIEEMVYKKQALQSTDVMI